MTFSIEYQITLASLHRSLQKARRELDAATPLSREWMAARRELDELHRTIWLLEQAQRAARHDIDVHRTERAGAATVLSPPGAWRGILPPPRS